MKVMSTSEGRGIVIIDDEDYEYLSKYIWYSDSRGYVFTKIKSNNGKWEKIFMHRLLLNLPKGKPVDHINNNKWDNRRRNLRVCENLNQNRYNTLKRNHNKSGYKGVSWKSENGKWVAQIQLNKKSKHIGYFDNPIDAAKAYDKEASEKFGEFAYLNFGEQK